MLLERYDDSKVIGDAGGVIAWAPDGHVSRVYLENQECGRGIYRPWKSWRHREWRQGHASFSRCSGKKHSESEQTAEEELAKATSQRLDEANPSHFYTLNVEEVEGGVEPGELTAEDDAQMGATANSEATVSGSQPPSKTSSRQQSAAHTSTRRPPTRRPTTQSSKDGLRINLIEFVIPQLVITASAAQMEDPGPQSIEVHDNRASMAKPTWTSTKSLYEQLDSWMTGVSHNPAN
eukprot:Clim_evm89s128 gene=Clim_evmTU89s128